MNVIALETAGNSSKFQVTTKSSEFVIAISFTLRTQIWLLADADAELAAASDLAEAIVSRHDHSLPFPKLYIFAEHTADPSLATELQRIRKHGF